MKWKWHERKHTWLSSGPTGGTEENQKVLSQNSKSAGQVSNPRLNECGAGV